jgi:outer membrane receptor protein involved in Fe transport
VISYPAAFFADARPNTALDMVQRLPGFVFDAGAGTDVRGLEGGAGNVLIDGRRSLSKTEPLEETLRRVPAGAVERIDIIRGGAPGIDMQGRPILANVVRRTGGGVTGSAQASTVFLWDGRVAFGLRGDLQRRWDDRALEGSLVYGTSIDDGTGNGYRLRTDGAGNLMQRSEVTGFGGGPHYAASGAFETPLWGGRLRLNTVAQYDPFHAVIDDRFTDGTHEREEDFINTRRLEFGARLSHPFAPQWNTETVLLQRFGDDDTRVSFTAPSGDNLFELEQRTTESVVHSDLTWTPSPRFSLKLGAEGAFNRLDGRTRLLFDGASIALPAANVRVEEQRGEALAEATWRPRSDLTVEAGLHVEVSTISASGDAQLEKTLVYPKPRLMLTWSPSPAHQLRFRFERTVGQLNFNDFVAASSAASTGVAVAGNPDIVPQQAWAFEAAYEHRFWNDAVASLTYRHERVNDVVDRIPLVAGAAVIDAPGNIGDGTFDTVTAEATLPLSRFGLPGAQIRPSLTWRRQQVTDPVTGATRMASRAHRWDWEVHFKQDLPNWRFNWGADVFGGYSETTYLVSEIDTFQLHTYVGLYAEYKPRPNLLFRVEVQNVTGRNSIFTRRIYDGPRSTGQLAVVDRREMDPGPMLFLRLRQTI